MTDTDKAVREEEVRPVVAKRVLSAEQLEKLKQARAKALEKKKLQSDIRRREKAAKDTLLQERLKRVEEIEASASHAPSKKKKGVK